MSSDVTNDELIEILADGLLCESDRCLSHLPNACTCALAAERLKEALGKLDRYRSALERIIESWDGDSESMHNDPAVIAREALSDE